MSRFDCSEGIARGHPDKIADQISDAILDACLRDDPTSRVAVEAMVSHQLVGIGGEISTSARLDVEGIVRSVLCDCGYKDLASQIRVVSSLCQQSPDISQSVGVRTRAMDHLGAGDQGLMFGYACNDTPTYMPKSHEIARTLVREIEQVPSLGPDGKTQVAIDLREPTTRGSVIVSWQHPSHMDTHEVRAILEPIVQRVTALYSFSPDTVLINPSGHFVLGGPLADTGLTGRKQIVDSYGGSVPDGGGAYSGKDATKVDRSGAYMARWVAKHVVASGCAARCEIQLVYSIGRELPLHIGIDCLGTETIALDKIEKTIATTFDFSVAGIIRSLGLARPIYYQTAYGGHFGRPGFPWEELPYLEIFSRLT